MDQAAFFMDSWFDWFGYEEIPHSMRYSFVLLVLAMPVYALFFFWCCLHNDEYEDESEEILFKQRVAKAFERKQMRLKTAKEMKFD